ncbi:MAG: DNA-directed RNA polymerase subunit omega [Acidobacteria bacterium]|nr:MAG: DNA-directed RNA polymerase subunit omega [Acidobacteriota bacterium]
MDKPIEDALKKIPNRFLLTTVVARRWESLVAGSPPLVEVRPGMSKIDIVLREILEDRVTVDPESKKIVLAGEPEVEEHDEPLFNEPLVPDSESIQRAVKPEGE